MCEHVFGVCMRAKEKLEVRDKVKGNVKERLRTICMYSKDACQVRVSVSVW